ncbi:hypothetical protein P7K49_016764 [Saguinus oedipus]|uniref:Uncharacterized protein n=1 Tax=Saguinus oedipus TaxID=9490 RepID=A0ABQ9VDT3_SAGOE|nr:hypothetical protein P7K49_016764 [Saguinus oedipus]
MNPVIPGGKAQPPRQSPPSLPFRESQAPPTRSVAGLSLASFCDLSVLQALRLGLAPGSLSVPLFPPGSRRPQPPSEAGAPAGIDALGEERFLGARL